MFSFTEIILIVLMTQGFIGLILPKLKGLRKTRYEIEREFGYISVKWFF